MTHSARVVVFYGVVMAHVALVMAHLQRFFAWFEHLRAVAIGARQPEACVQVVRDDNLVGLMDLVDLMTLLARIRVGNEVIMTRHAHVVAHL